MKKPIIVGNWKANKDLSQAQDWVRQWLKNWPPQGVEAEIILAPSFIHLAFLRVFFSENNLPIKLCAQDISIYPSGAYTGEISGQMLLGSVDYVLIGHSERRKYFQETEEILRKKVTRAKESHLKPIFCVSEMEMPVPDGVEIIAYEPLFAIGSGIPDNPENANAAAGEIKKSYRAKVIYGGSVKPENAKDFLKQPNIDGLLPGGASLSASEFLAIIQNAT